MIETIFIFLTGISPKIKRTLWRWWYQIIAKYYQKSDFKFMNYGFCDLNSQLSPINLSENDEINRYFIQLYHYVITATDITENDLISKKILEVGCGRGGGTSYIAQYLKPQQMVGVDFSTQNIKLAQKFHQLSNLSFEQGDAENLPFDNDTFDIIINVESSHCYGSMTKFMQEVARVLKPEGIFSWADLIPLSDVEKLKESFKKSGLKQLKTATITPNILKALSLVDEDKQNFINKNAISILKKAVKEFAGVKDGKIYKAFESGEMLYLSYVFQKKNY